LVIPHVAEEVLAGIKFRGYLFIYLQFIYSWHY